MKPITILVAEGYRIAREKLRERLEMDDNVVVVGEAKDGFEAVALARKYCPDVVMMDVALPLLDGLDAARQVLKALPLTKVIMYSGQGGGMHTLSEAERDAPALSHRQTYIRQVCQSIPQVHCATLLNRKIAHLTAREMEVLQLIAQGNGNKATAAELGIGIKTVEKHREHLMEKLNIHETAGLTRYALAVGIIGYYPAAF